MYSYIAPDHKHFLAPLPDTNYAPSSNSSIPVQPPLWPPFPLFPQRLICASLFVSFRVGLPEHGDRQGKGTYIQTGDEGCVGGAMAAFVYYCSFHQPRGRARFRTSRRCHANTRNLGGPWDDGAAIIHDDRWDAEPFCGCLFLFPTGLCQEIEKPDASYHACMHLPSPRHIWDFRLPWRWVS